MAIADEFPEHLTIEDAIDAQARGRVKKSSDEKTSVEYMTIEEMIKADQHTSAQTAAGKDVLGLRRRKLVPPSTG